MFKKYAITFKISIFFLYNICNRYKGGDWLKNKNSTRFYSHKQEKQIAKDVKGVLVKKKL